MTWEIRQGDALERLREMSAGSIQTCVTSPPYFGLRDYGDPGQLGLEQTPDEYVARLVEVFREVRRVLRDDGTLWLNLGDSYASQGGNGNQGNTSQRLGRRNVETQKPATREPPAGYKPKDLLGIPWMVAFALRADGWYLRSEIIWAKKNCMPESVRDRPTRSHEQIFLLSKQPRYYFDSDAIREDGKDWSTGGPGTGIEPTHHYGADNGGNEGLSDLASRYKDGSQLAGRNKRSVWHIATAPFPGAHFAVFSPKLIEPCVLAGSAPKACGVCGGPWERVTEREPDREWRNGASPGGSKRNKVLGQAEHRGSLSDVPRWVTETVGWKQSCECGDKFCIACTGYGFESTDPEDSSACERCRGTGVDPDHTVPSLVLDPFAGAGTTGLVALQHGRSFIGIELNPEYVQMASERIATAERLGFRTPENGPVPIPGQLSMDGEAA